MGVAEMTTVSPGMMETSLWSSFAMRTRAEVGSPWEPVVTMTARSGGSCFSSSMRTMVPEGALR
jgi:hypothetical protein